MRGIAGKVNCDTFGEGAVSQVPVILSRGQTIPVVIIVAPPPKIIPLANIFIVLEFSE